MTKKRTIRGAKGKLRVTREKVTHVNIQALITMHEVMAYLDKRLPEYFQQELAKMQAEPQAARVRIPHLEAALGRVERRVDRIEEKLDSAKRAFAPDDDE